MDLDLDQIQIVNQIPKIQACQVVGQHQPILFYILELILLIHIENAVCDMD